jgi:hypothetical protein
LYCVLIIKWLQKQKIYKQELFMKLIKWKQAFKNI